MNIIDYALIAIVVISVVVGALRGFLREAVSLAAWVAGFFLAWHFGSALEPHLGTWLAKYPLALTWTARGIIFLVVLLIGAAVGGLLGHFARVSIFSGLDRLLGMLFGALRGFLMIGVLVIFGQLLRLDSEKWWHKSLLMPQAVSIANGLRTLVSEPRPGKETSV